MSDTPCTTIADCIERVQQRLQQSDVSYGQGSEDAEQEAHWLVLHVMQQWHDAAELETATTVPAEAQQQIETLLQRRIDEHAPMAYLTHEMWFATLPFYVDERVLIPRSHIGEFIEEGFEPWFDSDDIHDVLDLCTGSGCIAIAMAVFYEQCQVDASDISAEALAVATMNIEKYDHDEPGAGLKQRVHLIQSDLFEQIPAKQYDLILSNPPYVDAATMGNLPPEFRQEPAAALASGEDGLDAVRTILQRAADYLQPHGILVCEVGDSAAALMEAFPQLPFLWLETRSGDTSVFLLTRQQLLQKQQ